MRITLVSHQVGRNDGQGRVNYEIAMGALAAGWNVTIIAMRCAQDLANHPGAKVVRFNVERLPTQLLRNIIFAILSGIWITCHRRTLGVLHVNGGVTLTNCDVNTVHFVHRAWKKNKFFPFANPFSSPYTLYQWLYTWASEKLELFALAKSRRVIAVSNKVQKELQEISITGDHVIVISNGVDIDEFHPGNEERARFGLPDFVTLYLFAGDIRTTRKNLDTVLTALAEAPGIHLAVAGDTTGSPFPALSKVLGINERVHFLGKVKDIPALTRSVDAMVFPSRYDPAGLVILEALASGIPVLTACTAGASALIGPAGRCLIDPEDSRTLSDWMRELQRDHALRSSMGAIGRMIAMENTWNRMSERYRQVYSEVDRNVSKRTNINGLPTAEDLIAANEHVN